MPSKCASLKNPPKSKITTNGDFHNIHKNVPTKISHKTNEEIQKFFKKKPPYVLEGNTILPGLNDPINELQEEFFDEELHSQKNFFKLNKKGEQRDYCFTLFPNVNNLPDFNSLGNHKQVRYLIVGEEYTPTTKKLHYQCYIYFHNNKNFSSTKKLLFGLLKTHCNFRKCRGSTKENIAYCSKDEKYNEFGNEPIQGARTDFEAIHTNLKEGTTTIRDIILTKPLIYHQFSKVLNATADALAYNRDIEREWMTEGIYCYGGSGLGKSYKWRQERLLNKKNWFNVDNDVYKKQWWDGYTNQENVLLNEFRGQITEDELFELVDEGAHSVPIRGQTKIPFLAKRVIITTCLEPKDLYPNYKGEWKQFYRRFKIYYYFALGYYTEVKLNDDGNIIKCKMLQKIEKNKLKIFDEELYEKKLKLKILILWYRNYNKIKIKNPLDDNEIDQ